MTTLILIRHGHTDWADKKLAGWLPDVHLNDHGPKASRRIAAAVSRHRDRRDLFQPAGAHAGNGAAACQSARPAHSQGQRSGRSEIRRLAGANLEGVVQQEGMEDRAGRAERLPVSRRRIVSRDAEPRGGRDRKDRRRSRQRHRRRLFARRCDQTRSWRIIPASRWTTFSASPSARPRST